MCNSLPGERGPDGVGPANLAVDENVEDSKEGEGEEVEEDQVQPVDVHLPHRVIQSTVHAVHNEHILCLLTSI